MNRTEAAAAGALAIFAAVFGGACLHASLAGADAAYAWFWFDTLIAFAAFVGMRDAWAALDDAAQETNLDAAAHGIIEALETTP